MINARDYEVTRYLNKPRTLMKLEYDEIIPALVLFGFFWMLGSVIVGLVLAAAWISLLKKAKKGRGSGFLINLIYWYTPGLIHKTVLFQYSPTSDELEWRF